MQSLILIFIAYILDMRVKHGGFVNIIRRKGPGTMGAEGSDGGRKAADGRAVGRPKGRLLHSRLTASRPRCLTGHTIAD